jgi:hypothetical protein
MDVIDAIRDILISIYLIAGIALTLALLVFAYLLFRAARGLLRALTRSVENLGKVTDAAVEHLVTPLEEGVSFGSVAGNAMGFATGFIAGLRGRKAKAKDDDTDGEGGRKGRWPWS